MTPNISLSLAPNGYIQVEDISTYTGGMENYTGVILCWSTDAFALNYNVDQTGFANSIWQISAIPQDTYSFYAFYFYKWDVSLNVSLNRYAIVWLNGVYYIKITSGVLNPSTAASAPDVDPTNWALFMPGSSFTINAVPYASLDAEDIYTLCAASVITNSQPIATTKAIIYVDTDQFVLTHLDCLTWKIVININCSVSSVKLYSYDHTEIGDLPILGNEVDVNLTDDGAYTVEIIYSPIGASYESIAKIPIYEVCQANECYTKLFKYIICSCNDPCAPDSEDCGKTSVLKQDMQLIRELVTQLNQMVFLAYSQTVGIYSLSTSQEDLITIVGQMIEELHIVTDRCGLCDSTQTLEMPC